MICRCRRETTRLRLIESHFVDLIISCAGDGSPPHLSCLLIFALVCLNIEPSGWDQTNNEPIWSNNQHNKHNKHNNNHHHLCLHLHPVHFLFKVGLSPIFSSFVDWLHWVVSHSGLNLFIGAIWFLAPSILSHYLVPTLFFSHAIPQNISWIWWTAPTKIYGLKFSCWGFIDLNLMVFLITYRIIC